MLGIVGLLEEIEGPTLDCGDGHRYVAMPGDEDERRLATGLAEIPLKVKARQARQTYIAADAGKGITLAGRKISLGAGKGPHVHAAALQQELQRVEHRLVVFDQRDRHQDATSR